MPSTMHLMLRSAHKARLEARTTSMQALVRCFQQFFFTLFRGNDKKPQTFSTFHNRKGGAAMTPLMFLR